MKIFWYGHSRYRIETGSSAILIDPFLNGDPKCTLALPRVGQAITD